MRVTLLTLIFVNLMPATTAIAHGGRLDAQGGHYDRKNGGYHYHNNSEFSPTPSIPTSPRTEARTSPTTNPRTEYRTTTTVNPPSTTIEKTRARIKRLARVRRASTYYEAQFNGVVAEVSGQTNLQSDFNADTTIFWLCEISSFQQLDEHDFRFIAMAAADLKNVVRVPVPDPTLLFDVIRQKSEGNVKSKFKFFLNGMSQNGISWANSEITDDKIELWMRDVDDIEYDQEHIVALKFGNRVWTDVSGKHETIARFISRNGDRVMLLKSNGFRVCIGTKHLSQNDRVYLENL